MNDPSNPTPFGRHSGDTEFADGRADVDQQAVAGINNGSSSASRRSRKARSMLVRFFNLLLTIIVFIVIGFVALIWYGNEQFNAPGPLKEKTTYVVEKGATFRSIQTDLVARGIIPNQGVLKIFERGVRAAGKSAQLKAGEFGFTPAMSMRDVMMELTEGRAIEYSMTFPEGWTSYQIMERIQFDTTLVGDMPAVPVEGSLLPNTYAFPRGATREQVVQRMKDAQINALERIWANRAADLPIKTPQELVILASIVEKETGVGSERPHVASVFMNRLNKGMKLESDPTIIYGIFGGKGKPKDRPIFKSDIRRPTPYNTYTIEALPPTPIANPGLASMEAVANPLQTNDLFFVADGTGGHAFAETLQQHNINVANWRKLEAQKKAETEQNTVDEQNTVEEQNTETEN